jgi:hypothetical protein
MASIEDISPAELILRRTLLVGWFPIMMEVTVGSFMVEALGIRASSPTGLSSFD